MSKRSMRKLVGAVLSCTAIAAGIVLLCVLRGVRYLPDEQFLQIAPVLAIFVALGTFFALRTQRLRILGDALLVLVSVLSVVGSILLP